MQVLPVFGVLLKNKNIIIVYMTFIPSVLTKNDQNNSTSRTATSYNGTSTLITGYNTILVTLTSNLDSNAGGLEIEFSSDNSTWTTYYTDTYFSGTIFSKSYKIIDSYYRIKYTTASATFTITSRLSTAIDNDATSINSFYSNIDDGYHDAFGKLRVANPYTLLDIKFPSDTTATPEYLSNDMLICTDSTDASATFGSSKCVMTTSTNSGYYITQSRKYCIYQPGKSLLFLASGIIDDSTNTGTYTARIGYFDDNNGLFFENSSETINVVLRNNSSDTSIAQTDWNIDKFDGTGISGLTIEFQNSQLFVIDFEWLSVGRIRFGFYLFGRIYYCHQITNINSLTAPYMLTPNLPIRHEIRLTSGNVSLTQICSSVISEGGYNPIGRPFSISNNIAAINATTTETPILALRGNLASASSSNNQYYHQNIVPSSISVFGSSNPDFIFRIRLYLSPNSPDVTTWTAVNNNSVSQYAVGGGEGDGNITDITNPNILVDSSYANGKGSVAFQNLDSIFSNLIQITSDIANISDVFLITAQTLSGNANIYASINWNEAD